jgi:hypothetical protein
VGQPHEANERAAGLERETASLRLQLEREVQKRAPRWLTDEQKAVLTNELRGKIPSITFVVQNDPEAQLFAIGFEIALQDAGAKLLLASPPGDDKWPISSGLIMHKPGDQSDIEGDPLCIALKKIGMFGGTASKPFTSPVVKSPNAPLLPDGYILYIGQKPLF